jgi:hypothetical protein
MITGLKVEFTLSDHDEGDESRCEVEEEEETNDLAQFSWTWLGGAGAW